MRCPRANPAEGVSARAAARAAVSGALLLPLLLGGCFEGKREVETLQVERTSPPLGEHAEPLMLNDALTIYFSGELMKRSVTPDSVVLLDENGHQVPGDLDVGNNWLAFRPEPPLAPDLMDGSFRPGGRYRLVLTGHPRPDAIRGRDGRWLEAGRSFEVRVAERDQAPRGLPAILRPPARDLPFFLVRPDTVLQVAADAPVLQLHFTLPVLPSSVTPECFRIQMLRDRLEPLRPRSVRVVTSPVDEHPGSTVEIDLGSLPAPDGLGRPGFVDSCFLTVQLDPLGGLLDYAGREPPPWQPLFWTVVPGGSVPLCEWPGDVDAFASGDGLSPGFEVVGDTVAPRVRVEAGNGQLGAFEPLRDCTIRVGEPFDRGDGQLVVGEGSDFAFTSIDVPEGVTVTVDARSGPVRLLVCGGVSVRGTLRLLGPTAPVPTGSGEQPPVAELLSVLPIAICAAGDVQLSGDVVHDAVANGDETGVLFATAGDLWLEGALPFQALLAVDRRAGDPRARIHGPRGQARPIATSFTTGVAPGSAFEAVGELPWCRLPAHRDSGELQLDGLAGGLVVEWQSAPPDAIRADRPDLGAGRVSRWRRARDGDVVVVGAGAFVRCRLRADVQVGAPTPALERVRLIEK